MSKISIRKKLSVASLALAIGFFSSCSSQQSSTLPEEDLSDAALLSDAERATPVLDDASVFADLNAAPASDEAPGAASAGAGDPFYNPIGGESLGRVAYTLYGDRGAAKALLAKNPELAGVGKLSASQKVYFDFDQLKPQPMFLTKDLIDRYPEQLAAQLEKGGFAKTSATLEAGETLQSLSQRLYGTTRYWTEIYLLNRGTLASYDRVRPGTQLAVYERAPVNTLGGNASPSSQEVAQAPVMDNNSVVTPYQAPTQPVAQPVTPMGDAADPFSDSQSVMPDPIPETPPAPSSAVAPVEMATPAIQGEETGSGGFFGMDSTNVRRVVYLLAILLIGGLAFYFTRPKKKSFDMLDPTNQDDSHQRPRFGGPKDNQKQGLG